MTASEQRVALVTGASSGIGKGIAGKLLAEGYKVIALQRRDPDIEHADLVSIRVDLTDIDALQNVCRDLTGRYQIDCVVNNASVNRPADLSHTSIEDLRYVFELNLVASLVIIKAVVPSMKQRSFGRIVSIASRAVLGKKERVAYSSSKAGLIGLTRTLCLELAGSGITVNAVSPGAVETELFTIGHPVGSAKREKVIQSIPLRSLGQPGDIANVVKFLLSDEARYITGQNIFVCGGLSVSGSGGE